MSCKLRNCIKDFYTQFYFASAMEDNPECVEVLADYVEEFDVSSVLPILPDDWSMSTISKALHRAFRLKLHQVGSIVV
jgi:hypothetical protein